VICFCQNRVLEIRVSIKEELKLKSLGILYPTPLNIFKVLESSFITLSNLMPVREKKIEIISSQALKFRQTIQENTQKTNLLS
jgi:hypothetical protein